MAVASMLLKALRAVTQFVHSYLHPRNHRPHQGVDVLCSDGATVYAPFTGRIVGQEKPYKTKNAINNGVRIAGGGK
ncbi:Leukocyte cell-derived chemotaxin-2, partial [Galemys pyrenaicus]